MLTQLAHRPFLQERTQMKLVTAIIRPETCDRVQKALADLGLSQLTLTDAWGQGHEHGHTYIYRATAFEDTRLKRLKLEVAVRDEAVDDVVEAILTYARTGSVGDGVIMVTQMELFIRIRTGQCVSEVDLKLPPAEPAHTHNRIRQTR